jgi:chloramphenicol-sensitive protein RarD
MAAFTSYFLWGVLPVYWKALDHVSLVELMVHRAWWTLVAVTLFLTTRRELSLLITAWKSPAIRRAHLIGSLLLMGNWGFYIVGVNSHRILETSLGYFLVPLLNAALGSMVFRENLRRAPKVALSFATLGVLIMVWQIGKLPWIAFGIAATWSAYGLVHKRSSSGALTGLAIETSFAAPFALGYIIWLGFNGQPHFGGEDHRTTLLMIGTGVISMVPLTLFALGARRLRFTTLGVLQYVAPSCQFLIGWLVYHEPLSPERISAFALIWIGLAIYTVDSIKSQRH